MGNVFGDEFGDDMFATDMVALDGMGMGEEFGMAGRDVRETADAEREAAMSVDLAKMDGMSPQTKAETGDDVEDALDPFGVDYF